MASLPAHPGAQRVSFDTHAPLVSYLGSSPPTVTDECREILYLYGERKSIQLCRRGPWMISASGAPYQRSCDNKWACPQCSPKLLRQDREHIARVLQAHETVIFMTFSISHTAPLAQSLTELQQTWTQAFTTGSWMSRFKIHNRMAGWVRATEVTFSETTAHPHLHALFAFDGKPGRDAIAGLRAQWTTAATRLGFATSGRSRRARSDGEVPRGARRGAVAYYLTEQSALHRAKPGKQRGPGDLLHSVVTSGDHDDLIRLREFHEATKGRHKVASSKGFRGLDQ